MKKISFAIIVVLVGLFLLPNQSFANDACKLITKMLDDGCDCTFKKYKGEFLKGNGVITNTRDKFVFLKTNPVVIIDCENNKGVIKIIGDFLAHPNLRRGDKAKFYMGKAETWKWQKYIDTNETYLMIVINGGRVNFDKYRWGP